MNHSWENCGTVRWKDRQTDRQTDNDDFKWKKMGIQYLTNSWRNNSADLDETFTAHQLNTSLIEDKVNHLHWMSSLLLIGWFYDSLQFISER